MFPNPGTIMFVIFSPWLISKNSISMRKSSPWSFGLCELICCLDPYGSKIEKPPLCHLIAVFWVHPCLDSILGLNDGGFVGLSQNLKILFVTSLGPTLIFHQWISLLKFYRAPSNLSKSIGMPLPQELCISYFQQEKNVIHYKPHSSLSHFCFSLLVFHKYIFSLFS